MISKNQIKRLLHIDTLERQIDYFIELEKAVETCQVEVDTLVNEHDQVKNNYFQQLKNATSTIEKSQQPEQCQIDNKKFIEQKYNRYFSGYIDEVKILKDNIEKAKKKKDNYLKSDNILLSAVTKNNKVFELEKNGNFAYKYYAKNGLGRARESIPQIESKDMDSFLMHFSNKVKITKEKMKLREMVPSQKDFNEKKILDVYKNENYKTHKYIISKDNYLMDGHHNWAGGLENNKEYKVDIYRINLPIKELLKRSNLLKISTKKDINDKELVKALLVIVKGYELGKVNEEQFEKAKAKLQVLIGNRNIMGGAELIINPNKNTIKKDKEKDVRPINREVLNPDDGKPQKASKDYVMYNDESPSKTGKEKCSNCGWFNKDDNTCQIVKGDEGDILPEGWCTLWGIDLLLEGRTETKEMEQKETPAKQIKEKLNKSHEIRTMWQLEDKLKNEGKIVKGQALVFFCPVYLHGQKIVNYLLEKFDEHGEKILFSLPIITDENRIKTGLEQMESLGIENPKQYLKKKDKGEDKGKMGLITYSMLPGIEGVHNKYEYIANEFVQLGAFQIVPEEWVNQGDPVNESYKFPGEDGYSPYWRIPSFEEFKKLRPDLAKGYKETDEGVIKLFKEEDESDSSNDIIVKLKKKWKYKDAIDYADKLINQFGDPDNYSENSLVWYNKAGFEMVEVKDEKIEHNFPEPHFDFVYSTVTIPEWEPKEGKSTIPSDIVSIFADVSGSIIIDGLQGTVTARCGMLIKNADTITFVKKVVAGEITENYKGEYAKYIVKDLFGDWYKDELKEKKS